MLITIEKHLGIHRS